MIECSGVNCPGNNWYHLECIGMEEEDVPDDDYYCSDQCRKKIIPLLHLQTGLGGV